jgi:hypothetical protein
MPRIFFSGFAPKSNLDEVNRWVPHISEPLGPSYSGDNAALRLSLVVANVA